MITLDNGRLRLALDPSMGASVHRLEGRISSAWRPICEGEDAPQTALQSALFVMAPFANRARENRLVAGDKCWPVTPNTDEPLALHGSLWAKAWERGETSATHATLSAQHTGDTPYPFAARLDVRLDESAARFTLTLTNTGSDEVPVGMGFHPYFPRLPDTEIRFAARDCWSEGEDYLPLEKRRPDDTTDYTHWRPLVPGWQNTCYGGWNGVAEIDQPSLGYRLTLRAEGGLTHLMTYWEDGLGRFALEPQSHLSGLTAARAGGLHVLGPASSLSQSMQLTLIPDAPALSPTAPA